MTEERSLPRDEAFAHAASLARKELPLLLVYDICLVSAWYGAMYALYQGVRNQTPWDSQQNATCRL